MALHGRETSLIVSIFMTRIVIIILRDGRVEVEQRDSGRCGPLDAALPSASYLLHVCVRFNPK